MKIREATIDVSVFIDYFLIVRGKEFRHRVATKLFSELDERASVIYEPFLFDIEFLGVMVRYIDLKKAIEALEKILKYVVVLDEQELHDKAREVSSRTGCRAVDAYYIATASITNSVLITNDRIMKKNAEKAGIKAYYLVEEYSKIIS